MAKGVSIQVIGAKGLERRFRKMPAVLQRRALDASAEAGADLLAKEIRSRAPVGRTGNLRKDVRSKRLTRGRKVRHVARWEAGAYARHAHLVEYGTRKRRVARGRGMPIADRIIRRSAAPMPAKPFFRPAVQSNRRRALGRMVRVIERSVARAFTRPNP